MTDLLKKFIFTEGYDEQKAKDAEEKNYWQDVIRAEQNKLLVQETLEAIETHFDIPCAIVYIGDIKGIIPITEFGISKNDCITCREDLGAEDAQERMNNSYRFLRSMVGQKIAFFIKGHDKAENIFTGSRKEALEFMKHKTEEEITNGTKTIAVIRNVMPWLAIADIGGIPALLPAAEYRYGWTDDLTEHLQVGDHIRVVITEFDKEQGRVIISRKLLTTDPWEKLDIKENGEYHAEITGIRENGCYFRIKTKGGYADGLFFHPRHSVLNRGDMALVRVLNINVQKRFIFGLFIRPINVA